MASSSDFKQLSIAVVGGGLGGLAAAVALRRAGHLGQFLPYRSSIGTDIICSRHL